MTPCLVWVGRKHCYQRCHHLHPVSSLKVFHLFCCCFYCLLFTLYLLAPDNTSVTVHAVSPSSRQRSCSSFFQMMQWYVLTPDNTSVTVHVVSPYSRQHISYCSCCISLLQTTHQLLFTLYLLVPNNTSVTVHAVSSCSRRHSSCCSHCISWPVTPGCRTKPMKRCSQSHQSIQPHSLHTTSTA